MPFWKPLVVEGNLIDLSHLEPFEFTIPIRTPATTATIVVHFNDHCFSETFDPNRHGEPLTLDHVAGHEKRAFEPLRYALSTALPGIVRGLDGQRIYNTRSGNLVRVTLQDGRFYPVFFTLRFMRKGRVALYVVSAFPWDRKDNPATTGSMRFNTAVEKILRGEKPRFPRR